MTRCPTCQTLFKVVPDQLRISEGWVRCGQCDEVFDASIELLPNPLEETAPPLVIASLTDRPDDELPVAPKLEPEGEPEPEPEPESESESESELPLPDPEPERLVQLSEVSFLRDATSRPLWRRRLMRVVAIFLSLALLLSLLGQIVFHERDRIAAAEPDLKPGLLAFCKVLNCTLSPMRKIESMVIDSSSFIKIQEDSYRLNFVLKNTANTALAAPAIELTLTDSLEQPVLRRVFLAAELGIKADALAAGLEWPVSLALALSSTGSSSQVAGYRLLAFYP